MNSVKKVLTGENLDESFITNNNLEKDSLTDGFNELIKGIYQKSFTKVTLGGCFIDRVNKTILISRER